MPQVATLSQPNLAQPDRARYNRQLAIWLFCVCAMIFLMIVVGGATRLTLSGLSMVTWKPISGIIPPLTDQAWQAEFLAYQKYPQYQLINHGMDMAGFKHIFWWEYGHRLLGRLIGFAFAIPFLYFLAKGRIAKKLRPQMVLMLLLGGCQGLLGWYMVKSGLIDRPGVSHYRLTAHLALALLIYSYIFWTALGLVAITPSANVVTLKQPGSRKLKRRGLLLLGLIILQILLGGFVAGLRAGFIDNTWPLMEGGFLPSGLLDLHPWYQNFLENLTTVQFSHRITAYLIAIAAVYLWLKTRKSASKAIRLAGHLVLLAMLCQITLGILTLIYVVPVPLATAHQGGAVLLLTATLYTLHRIWQS